VQGRSRTTLPARTIAPRQSAAIEQPVKRSLAAAGKESDWKDWGDGKL
jgi:hypothetical protein